MLSGSTVQQVLLTLAVFIVPFATALYPVSKMMKQPLLVCDDVSRFPPPLQGSPNGETEQISLLQQYEIKHPESAAAAAAYVANLCESAPKSRPKMIIFDKDGTLGDCTASLRRWVLYMTDKLMDFLTFHSKDDKQTIIQDFYQIVGWDATRNDVVPSAPVAAGTWDDIVGLVHEFLVKYASNCPQPVTLDLARKLCLELGDLHGQDPPLLDDLKAMMRACQNMGYIVAICTSDDRAGTDLAMKAWGIDTIVDVSVCGDEVSHGKPSAVPLQVLCQRANNHVRQKQGVSVPDILPQDCILVGDTIADTGMSRAAKVGFCVGVLTGSGTTEQLLETGAHLILPHVGHIPALLETLEEFASAGAKSQ